MFREDAHFGGHVITPGERRTFRFECGETYHGDSLEIPVTVINGEFEGPTVFLTAAVHGDELNGVKIVQEVARQYDPEDIHGTLVCLHVLNVPGFLAQQRYVPIYDEDLNRSFPGGPHGTLASRLANMVYTEFISNCDLGIDFHTSTRNRATMYHVRADMRDPDVERVARAFGTSVILDGKGSVGTLRRAACRDGIPTVTVEMGRAHRFQTAHLDRALHCVASVLAEHEVLPDRPVSWPGWTRVVARGGEKRWLRAETAGLVEMKWGPHPLVEEGEPLFVVSDHFKDDVEVVRAPSTGLVVGVLENAVAYPGHPLCHFVTVDERTADIIREDIQRGVFDIYREGGFQWPEPRWYAEHRSSPARNTST
ncbi:MULTISPECIES: succinylglutamate desuccinylase/aspartoacylase family protein [Haloferax]|uniref:Deacylase n=2 Tax=Haloferax TaxID=2251 RepID=A0A6G1Z6X9_9EURY|nr:MULTISPECIES: succinylglutamate desuccinylase/aspartoacylase family protein [Haloferax]KAB1185133.1 succinylglutamate desuccinylase/aspartoacylase family protein [Haloferax sp. CBA1149]MRW82310.1 deacylase [Haloferax marinisediminis]